jgi:hypothetical protein
MGGHDEITLTPEERRALLQIEHDLAEHDPHLGRRLRARRAPGGARADDPRVLFAVAGIGCVLGAVVMLATFARWPLAGFAGVLVMAAALLVGARGLELRGAAGADPAPSPSRPSWTRRV